MAATNYWDSLREYCRRGGFEVYAEERAGLHHITIFHPDLGAMVTWASFDGSLEGTARYAMNEANLHRLKTFHDSAS